MTNPTRGFAETSSAGTEFGEIVKLFGGPSVLKHHVSSPMEAHKMILHGIPGQALEKLVTRLVVIRVTEAFGKALGMSERTFQRYKSDRSSKLSTEQSSKTWYFARILAKATSVFGSQEEAEKWMVRPAMGLDNQKPIDLLATAAGTEHVQEFLERLEYGVYV